MVLGGETRASLLSGEPVRREEFDCHVPVQRLVVRPIDHADAALAQVLDEAVAPLQVGGRAGR